MRRRTRFGSTVTARAPFVTVRVTRHRAATCRADARRTHPTCDEW